MPAQSDRLLTAGDAQALCRLATRRLNREPVARILGHKEFWGLPLRLSPDTLVPRPETETIVEAALDAMHERRDETLRIADLGTGSGAILLALLNELPHAFGVGTDRSMDAIATARAECSRSSAFGARGFHRHGFFVRSARPVRSRRFKSALHRKRRYRRLQPDVRDHDPHLALDGGADGLAAYRAIAADARRLLAPRGTLVVELGFGQLADVSDIMANAGLVAERAGRADLAGIPRALALPFCHDPDAFRRRKKSLGMWGKTD